jgi:arogenate/prephenate dehydratase
MNACCCVALQALAQTDTYLRKLGVVKEAVDDTAGAAQMVARQQLKVR